MLTLAKGLKQRKIRTFKAPKNQFSEFNIDNEVKPRQFQPQRDLSEDLSTSFLI